MHCRLVTYILQGYKGRGVVHGVRTKGGGGKVEAGVEGCRGLEAWRGVGGLGRYRGLGVRGGGLGEVQGAGSKGGGGARGTGVWQ